MEDNSNKNESVVDEEEEYVLLDLEAVYGQMNIPANSPYVLSGLDTLNPILIIGDNLKLIGEYDETIGTCYVFTETDNGPLVHEETGPSDANLFKGKSIVDPNEAAAKQVKPIASLHKILKFRLLSEFETQAETATFKKVHFRMPRAIHICSTRGKHAWGSGRDAMDMGKYGARNLGSLDEFSGCYTPEIT